MINKIQSKFNLEESSQNDTFVFDMSDYSKGPTSSFSAYFAQYLSVNRLVSPPFERFTFNTQPESNKIYDVPHILNTTIPVKMKEFFYLER